MDVVENLRKQLEETEMLQSIYAGEKEIEIDDSRAFADARRFVECEGDSALILKRISYTVNLSENLKGSDNIHFSILVDLPNNYPAEHPAIFVRSEKLDREEQKRLNEDLEENILGLDLGEVCAFETIQWTQENIHKYVNYSHKNKSVPKKVKNKPESKTFSRLWMLSHHIYSKFKRKDILEWGAELELTGFCLPGKPGIICVEGPTDIAEEFWSRVRRMTWKKISCKHREDYKMMSSAMKPEEKKQGRCFENFEEINFNARGFGGGRDYHMDLGMFQQFLEEKGLRDIFKILLGVEGKAPMKDN